MYSSFFIVHVSNTPAPSTIEEEEEPALLAETEDEILNEDNITPILTE